LASRLLGVRVAVLVLLANGVLAPHDAVTVEVNTHCILHVGNFRLALDVLEILVSMATVEISHGTRCVTVGNSPSILQHRARRAREAKSTKTGACRNVLQRPCALGLRLRLCSVALLLLLHALFREGANTTARARRANVPGGLRAGWA
jgi:hypothetical protein